MGCFFYWIDESEFFLLLLDVVADLLLACEDVDDETCNDQCYRTEADSIVVVPCHCHAQRDEYGANKDKKESEDLNLFCHSAICIFLLYSFCKETHKYLENEIFL